ncbi:MAG: flippase-like domain-containing protein [Planctomycetes bacterium]|nr:flippase-like domain-containing protein [Planctomycetota bacterium]
MKKHLWTLIKRFAPLAFGLAVLVYLFAFRYSIEDSVREVQVKGPDGKGLIQIVEGGKTQSVPHDEVVLTGQDKGRWTKPGIVSVVKRVSLNELALAIALCGASFLATALRLQYLVSLLGYRVGYVRCLAYTFIGQLYNTAIPGGAIGGDAVKALYLSRHTTGKAHAFAAVLVDRICGLFTLATLALVMLAPSITEPSMATAAMVIVAFLLAGSVAVVLMLSRRVRALWPEQWRNKLPLKGAIANFDQAVQIYRGRLGGIALALIISVLPQLGWIAMHVALGQGMGISNIGWMDYFVLVPVSGMVASLPISFGGWGVGEFAAVYFFGQRGVPGELALVLSFLGRLLQTGFGVIGLPLSLLLPKPKVSETVIIAPAQTVVAPDRPAAS